MLAAAPTVGKAEEVAEEPAGSTDLETTRERGRLARYKAHVPAGSIDLEKEACGIL
jgi:hypothetical protein